MFRNHNHKCAAFKCDISKCHAECCTFVSLHEKFILDHKDKIQRPIYGMNEIDRTENGMYGQCITHLDKITPELIEELKLIGETIPSNNEEYYLDESKQTCPFLTAENRCAVYDERPEICKIFGSTTEPDNTFTCHYHLGKSYHFPKKKSPEYKQINNYKYMVRDIYYNLPLFREMLPNESRKQFIKQLKLFSEVYGYEILGIDNVKIKY